MTQSGPGLKPEEDVALTKAIATNNPLPKVISENEAEKGDVHVIPKLQYARVVQVVPSGDVMTLAPPEEAEATATNTPLAKMIDSHRVDSLLDG